MFIKEGAESTLESRVVLPLPRKPVTIVTGLFAVLASPRQHLVQGGVERIERPAGELLRRGPQVPEVLHELGAALAVAHEVLTPAPVPDPETVVAQYLVYEGSTMHPVPHSS